jgi:hypothetical protein
MMILMAKWTEAAIAVEKHIGNNESFQKQIYFYLYFIYKN